MHSLAVEQEYTARSERLRAWGTGLLVVAGLLWVYAAWQMFVPYDDQAGQSCSAPAFADRDDLYTDEPYNDGSLGHDNRVHAQACAESRDWPAPVAAMVVSTPLGVAGAMTYTLGGSALRGRGHERRVESARAAEARS